MTSDVVRVMATRGVLGDIWSGSGGAASGEVVRPAPASPQLVAEWNVGTDPTHVQVLVYDTVTSALAGDGASSPFQPTTPIPGLLVDSRF